MIQSEPGQVGRPRVVDAAFAFMVGAIVANLAVWGLNLFVIPTPGFTQMRREMGEHGAWVELALTAAFWLIVSAVWLLLALKMRAGRNWARLVLGGIGVVNGLVSLGGVGMEAFQRQPATDFATNALLGVVPDLLAFGAAVLMFLPASNAYITITARAKSPSRAKASRGAGGELETTR